MEKSKRLISGAIAIGGVGAIVVAVAFGVSAARVQTAPEPTATVVSFERPADNVDVSTTSPSSERAIAARAAAEAQAAADAEAARAAADQQAAQQDAPVADAGTPPSAPAQQPAAPVRCPAGSSANSNDGVNDTSCFPDICFSIAVPDPAHPECDVAFRP